MILVDKHLIEYGTDIVEPFILENVNPASIDLRIDGTGIALMSNHRQEPFDATKGRVHCFHAQTFLLATAEIVKVPISCAAIVRLKSSSARAGWALAGAEYLDPGFRGIVTLACCNRNQSAIEIIPNKLFCQVIYYRLDGTPIAAYDGKYQDAAAAEADKSA